MSALFRLMGALSGAIFGAIVALITLDVALRNATPLNLPWLNEAVEYGLYLATFLGAPWVLRQGAHVRMSLIANLLPARAACRLALLANLLAGAACLTLVYYGAIAALTAYERGSLILKTLILPEWPLLAVLPASMALMAIEFGRRAARNLRGQTVEADDAPGL